MEIYKTQQAWAAEMLRGLLAGSGVETHVRETSGAYHRQAEYVVYLVNPADEPQARAIVEGFRENASAEPVDPRALWHWRCPRCGEDVEPQFGQCWNCQAERPARA